MSSASGLLSAIPQAVQQLVVQLGQEKVDAIMQAQARSAQPANQLSKKGIKAMKKQDATAVKNTRPLNSWIAFRCFYRNLLGSSQQKSIQQKEISGFLTKLWQADPFKAKWTILAKSYSVIRDAQGKKNAPLDEFLTMTGPLIGIVPPNLYFSVTGWQMSFSGDGQMVLARDHSVNLAYLDHNLLTTNMSVEDIINFCYHNGYVNSDGIVKLAAYGQSTLAMACTTNEPSTESLSDLSIDDLLAVVGGDEGQGGSFDEQDTYTPLNPVFTTNPAFDPQIALGNQSFEFDQALDSFYQDGSMVPNFDPYMGNSFNAYNISDFQTTEENEFNFLEFF